VVAARDDWSEELLVDGQPIGDGRRAAPRARRATRRDEFDPSDISEEAVRDILAEELKLALMKVTGRVD